MVDLSAENKEKTSDNPFKHFKRMLVKGEGGNGRASNSSRVESVNTNLGGFESSGIDAPLEPDLSNAGIRERLELTGSELHRIIKEFLDDKPEFYEIANKIVSEGDKAFRILRNEDEEKLARDKGKTLGMLEVIVRLDGSRPSFMIQNGEINRATSPLGSWKDALDASNDSLIEAISCVGRIDIPWMSPGFVGTGFLVQENLILTNRHVLQAAAQQRSDGSWKFHEETAIDFAHEFRATASRNRRALKRVVFCGPDEIDLNANINHKNLDLALIELEAATNENRPRKVLSIDKAPDWADPDIEIFTVGYPGKPILGTYTPTLLEQLFQSTFGYKRLAPGLIMPSGQNVQPWTLTHDATTLGGNSGSVVLVAGRETAAAGLHYGGQTTQPRQNWGHILGKILEQKSETANGDNGSRDTSAPSEGVMMKANQALIGLLKELGVNLVDRVTG